MFRELPAAQGHARLPPVEAAEVWAKAIENDLTISSVRWLWRLKATHTVQWYGWNCGHGRIKWLRRTVEVRNYETQWQGQRKGPGATEGYHPLFEAGTGAYVNLAKDLRGVLKKILKG